MNIVTNFNLRYIYKYIYIFLGSSKSLAIAQSPTVIESDFGNEVLARSANFFFQFWHYLQPSLRRPVVGQWADNGEQSTSK